MSTSIEWTDETWNPIVGCSRVSAGCEHCYAERVAHRGMSSEHRGLTVLGAKGPRWTGEVRVLPERLGEPLSWRKPRRVFVNSMSDLFHEDVSFEFIAAMTPASRLRAVKGQKRWRRKKARARSRDSSPRSSDGR